MAHRHIIVLKYSTVFLLHMSGIVNDCRTMCSLWLMNTVQCLFCGCSVTVDKNELWCTLS
jgi:hypothetical protein